ncbi:hypothetical protein BVG80_07915 [Sphingobacteriales bacterium TSM_CSM]|nr:hypothetical protein BVG80_07915 [Sphingobacteriales bacterium TSM_CSM]
MAQVFYGCRLCYMQSISNLLSAAAKIRKKATKRIRMLKFALTKPAKQGCVSLRGNCRVKCF